MKGLVSVATAALVATVAGVGGTLPIVPALADRGIPTVITGFSLPDCNIHSPNERLRASYLPRGVAAARALFSAWGALGDPRG